MGAKAGGGGGGGGSGIPPPSMPAPRGGSAHYNYPPRTFETNVLGREGRCQQRLLQADTSFSHTEHEKKVSLRKRWNGTGRQEEDKEFPRKNSKRRFCPSFGFCPFLVSLLRDVPPPFFLSLSPLSVCQFTTVTVDRREKEGRGGVNWGRGGSRGQLLFGLSTKAKGWRIASLWSPLSLSFCSPPPSISCVSFFH